MFSAICPSHDVVVGGERSEEDDERGGDD